MPIFALANAGVRLTTGEIDAGVFTAALVGLVIGKPIGVLAASFLAVRLRLAVLPSTLTWPMLAAGGILTGIGFTMALFIAELAFDPALLGSAKAGILAASTVAGLCGLCALLVLPRPKPLE